MLVLASVLHCFSVAAPAHFSILHTSTPTDDKHTSEFAVYLSAVPKSDKIHKTRGQGSSLEHNVIMWSCFVPNLPVKAS